MLRTSRGLYLSPIYSQAVRFRAHSLRWIASVMVFLTFIGSAASGRYFDAHGARALVISGTTLNIISLVGNACESQHACPLTLRERNF